MAPTTSIGNRRYLLLPAIREECRYGREPAPGVGQRFASVASAGVIHVVTKESTDYFSGKVQLTATDDHQRRAELSLPGPLSDALAFRLNSYADSRRGAMTKLTTGEDVNGDRSRGLRARLEFHPPPSI